VRPKSISVAAGLLLDRLVGEPPGRHHPVALLGSALVAVERRTYRDGRAAGLAHAAVGAALGIAAGRLTPTAVATWISVSGRMLGETATAIGAALERGDLEGARALLPALVGRDPAGLDEQEIVRAVVESVAENTVDAVVAPVLWAVVAGGAGALGYRAVNTLDSMVGHRSPRYDRFGWASARLDDGAGYVPARVTAALVAAVRPRKAADVVRTVRRDAPAHPSPNAGVAEAAFAAALGIRLGGVNRYGERVEVRPHLGDGEPPVAPDIARTVRLSRDVTLALTAAAAVPAVGRSRRGRPRPWPPGTARGRSGRRR
jgi:adenosylcobinamide-phosphate synthase